MDWKDLGKSVIDTIAHAAPAVGTALGGPLGGLAGAALAKVLGVEETPEAVERAILKADPETLIKLKEAEIAFIRTQNEILIAQITEVNKTMRAESTSEHWPQWSWRPFWGFISALAFFGEIVLLTFAVYKGSINIGQAAAVASATVPIWAVPGAILGITAYGRNRLKEARIGIEPEEGLIANLLSRLKVNVTTE